MQESAGTDARVQYEAALTAAAGQALPAGIDQPLHAFTLPWGAKLALVDLERFQANPTRPRGVVRVGTAGAFTEYVKLHSDSSTTVWVSLDEKKVVAVLNDHAPMVNFDPATQQPGWGDYRAELMLKMTPEWDFWTAKDGILVPQVSFAEHIEDGAKEIVTPDAATMLEIAQTFHAKTNVSFRSGVRLSSGTTQFLYDEEQTAKAGGKGQLEVPTTFQLGVAPFEGEPAYKVGARLRWRVRDGGLSIGYKLDRPQDVIRTSLEEIAERLAGDFEHVYMGNPRPAEAGKTPHTELVG
jgi:uncharacterized protein YfdQ (DUF2303 family)